MNLKLSETGDLIYKGNSMTEFYCQQKYAERKTTYKVLVKLTSFIIKQ